MYESSCLKADSKRLLGDHSQVRREAVGLWWGEEGAQSRGCLLLKFVLVFSRNHMFLEGAS